MKETHKKEEILSHMRNVDGSHFSLGRLFILMVTASPELFKNAMSQEDVVFDLKINDIDVPIEAFLKGLGESWDHCVKEEAKQIVENRMGKAYETIYNLERALEKFAEKELGMSLNDEDDF